MRRLAAKASLAPGLRFVREMVMRSFRVAGCPLAVSAAAIMVLAAASGSLPGASAAERLDAMPVRGVVRAAKKATLAADEPMRATRVAVRLGDAFAEGAVLVEFDCTRQLADRGAAFAALREAELNLHGSRKLDEFQAIGKIELAVSEQRRDRARHELASIDARLKACRVLAPFDGRVAEIDVREHELSRVQQPLLTIVSSGGLEFESIVPSRLLARLNVGDKFLVAVDEIPDRPRRVTIAAIAAAVDPVSKTGTVIAAFDEDVEGLLPGMSGSMTIPQGN